MRISLACLLALVALPAGVLAQDAPVNKQVHDAPVVRGSIIANLLQDHDNPFLLYPYESNYLLYTWTSDLNKEAIRSYDWAENARKDEVKFQLSLAFPLWRGILGENSLLGASYTQKSWWQLSNSKESAPFRETNYEPQLFLGLRPITRSPAGRCATLRWVITTTLTAVPIPPPAAGTASIPG
jgi:phospholipase A1